MKAFNRLTREFRKVSPRAEYACVKEEGSETGMRHLHVIIANWNFYPWAKLKALWRKYIGADGVHIKRVVSKLMEKVTSYAAKYVSKNVAQLDQRKIVTYSRDWPSLDTESELEAQAKLDYLPNGSYILLDSGIRLAWPDTGYRSQCGCFGKSIDPEQGLDGVWTASLTGSAARPELFENGVAAFVDDNCWVWVEHIPPDAWGALGKA
jgi:hypothetical protein|tara:strand:+ start:1444 stop:2067 length:624 start_codon:yes stop_codon:yes gene_type:complete